MATAAGTGSPCGACKFLRRKCAPDCIFAPYFCSEQGPARFAAIHKVFGASNASKILLHVPVADRCEAVVTIAYEAQARIRDPVYGCVAHIFALQQQVACLQAQLMQVKGQLAQKLNFGDHHSQWHAGNMVGNINPSFPSSYMNSSSSLSSQNLLLESIDQSIGGVMGMDDQEMQRRDELLSSFQPYSKKRPSQTDLSELQALAFRMMRD